MKNSNFKSTPISEWIKKGGFTGISRVVKHTKENNIPYVTFTGDNVESTNVFFSRGSSELVKHNPDVTPALLKQLNVVSYTAEDGLERIKFSAGQQASADKQAIDDSFMAELMIEDKQVALAE